jgi:hypothetical protein
MTRCSAQPSTRLQKRIQNRRSESSSEERGASHAELQDVELLAQSDVFQREPGSVSSECFEERKGPGEEVDHGHIFADLVN